MSALYIVLCYNVIRKTGDFMKLTHIIGDKVNEKHHDIVNLEQENDNKYKFYLDNIMNYIYITDRLIFIRQNDDYKFSLEISEKPTCTIELIKENKIFDVNVQNANYKLDNKKIELNYLIETDEGEHKIILEIGD